MGLVLMFAGVLFMVAGIMIACKNFKNAGFGILILLSKLIIAFSRNTNPNAWLELTSEAKKSLLLFGMASVLIVSGLFLVS
jgi:hypothetical protein